MKIKLTVEIIAELNDDNAEFQEDNWNTAYLDASDINLAGNFSPTSIRPIHFDTIKVEKIEEIKDTRLMKMTYGEFSNRFGLSKLEDIGLNSYAMNEGLATENDTIDINWEKAQILGISEHEFNSRNLIRQ